jgi:hypothetical protein
MVEVEAEVEAVTASLRLQVSLSKCMASPVEMVRAFPVYKLRNKD